MTNKKINKSLEEDLEEDFDEELDLKSLSALTKSRNIYLFGQVNKKNILDIIYKIHFCEFHDNKSEIKLYINSDGGYVADCFALIDVMDNCSCPISTIVLGSAASAACLISSNGTPGRRYAGKNSEFMYHEGYSDLDDVTHSQLKSYTNQFYRIQKKLDKIFKRNTGKTISEIKKEFFSNSIDRYMDSVEAKKFGIIDKILSTKRKGME